MARRIQFHLDLRVVTVLTLCFALGCDDGNDGTVDFDRPRVDSGSPLVVDSGTGSPTLLDSSIFPGSDAQTTVPNDGSMPTVDSDSGPVVVVSDAGPLAEPDSSTMSPTGMCCADGDCVCHGEPPSSPTSAEGPYDTDTFTVSGAGCVHYPTNAEPPFAAVAISDGFGGSGGCTSRQTGRWGPLYASWGIVTMIIDTTGGDQPRTRGDKLLRGIEALQAENQRMGSPLFGELAGRYGTSGFSMGGGGTTYAAVENSQLRTTVPIMPWGPPSTRALSVPTLVICGTRDTIASCRSHADPLYEGTPDSTPKMIIDISSGHSGQPSAGGGDSGEAGLAFQKVFLEGDERWIPILNQIMARDSTI